MLDIDRSNLKGKPVRVLIENVYLLAVPTDSSKATPEEDEARAQAAKQEKLINAEMMTSQPGSGMSEEDEKKNESFTASLVTKIVDNLQIEVSVFDLRMFHHLVETRTDWLSVRNRSEIFTFDMKTNCRSLVTPSLPDSLSPVSQPYQQTNSGNPPSLIPRRTEFTSSRNSNPSHSTSTLILLRSRDILSRKRL